MQYVSLDNIKNDLIKYFKAQNLYPVIGAGFSAKCVTANGVIPSGDMLKTEMLNQIKEAGADVTSISSLDLKSIAKYYKKLVPRNIRTKYLLENFTNVVLPDYAINFLNINWKYIYTFNIDSSIEENIRFNNIILPNKPGDEDNIKNMNDCIFKVHGDVVDYCKYTDSICYIFDSKEYAQSIKRNLYILNKLNHDFTYNNLIFIGCSLTDELDLLSLSTFDENSSMTSRYFVSDTKPDKFREIDLEEYGITHIILVDNYLDFYHSFYEIFLESEKLQYDELSNFKNMKINFNELSYNSNIKYITLSKSLFNSKDFSINIPSFFIERDMITQKVIPEMDNYNLQFICGGRVSGKTYALISILKIIRNRDVYFFDSRYNINDETVSQLLKTNNSIICFDTTSISKEQVYYIKENIETLYENKLNIVICINRSDKDMIYSINQITDEKKVFLYNLENKLKSTECKSINEKLSKLTIPCFDVKKSLLDNLLIISKTVSAPYKINKNYEIKNVQTMSIFILLAINEKITSQEFVDFGIEREIYDLLRKLSPIIDEDYTSIIERNSLNSSSYKIYANSRYWILSTLGKYASDYTMHKLIINAYYNIISCLINNHSTKYKSIEDYIKYDIINETFFRPDRGNLLLIKSLYDRLNDILSSIPQFHHQRAKCYLWHCDYGDNQQTEINDALRFAKLARHNLELQSNANNTKISISLSHIDFTLALIYAKINHINNYMNITMFKESLPIIKMALSNPYNKDYFYGLIHRKNKNIDDINHLFSYVTTNDLSYLNLSPIEKNLLDEIINIIYQSKQ